MIKFLENLGKFLTFILCLFSFYMLYKYFTFIDPEIIKIQNIINQDITTLKNLLNYFKSLDIIQGREMRETIIKFLDTYYHVLDYYNDMDMTIEQYNKITNLAAEFNEEVKQKWKEIEANPILSQRYRKGPY